MNHARTAAKRAATGSLIGLALGDALGLPTEFIDVPRIISWYGPWRELDLPGNGRVTDDTQMGHDPDTPETRHGMILSC